MVNSALTGVSAERYGGGGGSYPQITSEIKLHSETGIVALKGVKQKHLFYV